MKIILNEQGFINSYALIGGFNDGAVEVNEPENLEDFEKNYRSYYLSDGVLVKSDEKQIELDENKVLANLRSQREKVCFPYVNRGYLWYSRLNEEQKEELDTWYQAWLNVTEIKVIPETPEWLVDY